MTNGEDIQGDTLLDDVIEKLEQNELETTKDLEEFRERYSLLIDCAVDELNDEIRREKLSKVIVMLVIDGNHSVYRSDLFTSARFMGGEEFYLTGVRRLADNGNSKSLIGFLLKPVNYSLFDYLVVPYTEMDKMSSNFSAMVAKYLLGVMDSIEKDVFKLRSEMDVRQREREMIVDQNPSNIYASVGSW